MRRHSRQISVLKQGYQVRNYLIELIGTFFLVLAIGLTVVSPIEGIAAPTAGALAPLAIASP